MILIDTSSWIEALREDGNPDVRERVRNILEEGEVVFCDFVLLELWNGARGQREKKQLKQLEFEVPVLPITSEVWQLSFELAKKCREKGQTVPASDLLIAACARFHKVELEQCDSHFDIIFKVIDK